MTVVGGRVRPHQWLGAGNGDEYFSDSPIVVADAEGPYFTAADGRRFLDALCVQSAGVIGHNHPRVLDAMRAQMRRATTNVGGMLPTESSLELAERLAGLTGGELARVFYMVGGSDGNDAAIKLARQYQKNQGRGTKFKTIVRRHGYHGTTLATSAASGNHRYPHSAFEPLPGGFVHTGSPYPRGCTLCDQVCDLGCAEEIERTLRYEDPDTVAAVLVEPTMCVSGVIPPPPGYLRRLRELCDEHDVLLMMDEVVTAMGRAGTWFEFQREEIVPDVVVMAKVLTGGHMPLAALLARDEVADAFQGEPARRFATASTLAGTPLACAAALATIDVVADEGLADAALRLEELARPRLEALMNGSRIVAEVRTRGAMMGLEWVADRERAIPFQDLEAVKARAVAIGHDQGVHFFGAPASSLIWIPPSNIDDGAFDHLLTAVEQVVAVIEREFPD